MRKCNLRRKAQIAVLRKNKQHHLYLKNKDKRGGKGVIILHNNKTIKETTNRSRIF